VGVVTWQRLAAKRAGHSSMVSRARQVAGLRSSSNQR
jgi:hypothetical protein